jgi:hypothetical protein
MRFLVRRYCRLSVVPGPHNTVITVAAGERSWGWMGQSTGEGSSVRLCRSGHHCGCSPDKNATKNKQHSSVRSPRRGMKAYSSVPTWQQAGHRAQAAVKAEALASPEGLVLTDGSPVACLAAWRPVSCILPGSRTWGFYADSVSVVVLGTRAR